ncbi:hypothetical protein [Mucilaginibacter paludis]|uniref:Uncharacterized protein n=1 Tax=Mucilaginibacter paludis DSM 18603 TaxID=714943 RepID=H1YI25_9SPHI|nr:hypothetical protein [Mucilaginibacter paludis]EHQ25573.1 hypothetical protein Mucpa_1413 [Mucilaginibacter paludis DSM 18603]
MENSALTLNSATIKNYLQANHFSVQWEKNMIAEILEAIESNNTEKLAWFKGFGKDIRHILMNVHAYRKGLEFGFTEIAFDKNDWFCRSEFLEKEDIKLGDSERYGEYSNIYLGRGINHIWTYALNYSYGMAGGGYGLSIYGKQFRCRQDALIYALDEIKKMMTARIGDKDTTNVKQPVIMATLRAISQVQVSMVQLTLF